MDETKQRKIFAAPDGSVFTGENAYIAELLFDRMNEYAAANFGTITGYRALEELALSAYQIIRPVPVDEIRFEDGKIDFPVKITKIEHHVAVMWRHGDGQDRVHTVRFGNEDGVIVYLFYIGRPPMYSKPATKQDGFFL